MRDYDIVPRFCGAVQIARLIIAVFLFLTITPISLISVLSLGFWTPQCRWCFDISERIAGVFVRKHYRPMGASVK